MNSLQQQEGKELNRGTPETFGNLICVISVLTYYFDESLLDIKSLCKHLLKIAIILSYFNLVLAIRHEVIKEVKNQIFEAYERYQFYTFMGQKASN